MDTLKKIVHLKNFFETLPSNERFVEEKEWIIDIYFSCFSELVNAHRTMERQNIIIEQMREHIDMGFNSIHRNPEPNKNKGVIKGRSSDDNDGHLNKKSKPIWIKKSETKSTGSKS